MAGIKFRVLLDTSQKEEVFCDILLSIDDDFEALFNAIIEAYQFKGNQMASFYVSNETWDKGEEISLMDVSFGEPESQKIMSSTTIRDIIEDPNQKLILVYDFLKMWIFLIECIGIQEETPEKPTLLLSIGKKPKEDSKELDEDLQMPADENSEEEEDEYGFQDFEDGFSEEDLNPYT
ncbi:MAG: hypothetical protein QNL43_02080 [Crocinitomicaceae bacterium]|jgi:hypothetical protein|tara:strand:+ start:6790 stop:7323 length:534 start_codon:yes stop_codon:yes gene_type:complete